MSDSPTAVRPAPAPPRPQDDERVVPLRHPWRWVATALVLVLVAQVVHGLVTNPFYQWGRFGYWFSRPVILEGLLITLQVTAYSAVLGLAGGVLLALMRLSGSPVLQVVSWTFTWVFRSVPLIVVLIFLYNVSALYPELGLGIPFGPQLVTFGTADLGDEMLIAVVALSLNEAAFASEVVRGGLLSVDAGQREAAAALGLPRAYRFWRIVMPQALRSIVPNYVNQLIGIIKGSSLVFYVSLLDLFGTVQTMGATYPGDVIPLLLVATTWYVVLTSVVSAAQFHVERAFARGADRTPPPTPWQRVRAGSRDLLAKVRAASSPAAPVGPRPGGPAGGSSR